MDDLTERVGKLSMEYTKETSKAQLKEKGQFFTVDRELLNKLLDDYAWGISTADSLKILEPSCGTGMVIAECMVRAKEAGVKCHIKGMDIEESLVEKTRGIFGGTAQIERGDFLKEEFEEKYDLIVGNPPYFEMKLDSEQRDFFKEIICGRANIYALFIYRSIQLLRDGGELRFIIPRTILSGKYFSKLREYIHMTCEVIDIVKFSKSNMFSKALQSVIILKLRKGGWGQGTGLSRESKHIWERGGEVYFVKNKDKLKTEGKVFIRDLGCKVKTGSIVWNKHKNELQDEETKDTLPLVMASNLKSGVLEFCGAALSKNGKRQFMRRTEKNERFIERGPCILVNRIVGLDPPRLNAVLVKDANKQFFVENHVNVINGGSLENLERIHRGLKGNELMEFIEELIGSTQISQHELECILPIP